MSGPVLTAALLAELAAHAESVGLMRLGAVDLAHPGFAPARAALDRFLAAGKHGDMDFLQRTRDVRRDPAQMLPGMRTLLVAAVPYTGESAPIARYARTRDYHTIVHQRLIALERLLLERLPAVRTLICVDTKPLLERSAAALAGLGFLGKHGCLIVPGLGSYVLLGELACTAVLEDSPVPLTAPTAPPWDACGSCTRCLDACPTAAFDGPGDLDPRRCISYLTIEHRGEIPDALADRLGERIAGCDVCQEVCPYNASAARDRRVPPVAWIDPAPRTGPDVTGMAAISPSQYRAYVRHMALRRIPRRHMRRNALVALGNRSGPPDPRELHAIALGLIDREPLVVRAAARAAARRDAAASAARLADELRAANQPQEPEDP
jgi:epoxyqueuosine reductase